MKSRYEDHIADALTDPLALRAYTSRLLGAEPSLVLHGGGNTSVKVSERDFYGDPLETLYVKGSGWDLASIAPAGFTPVRLAVLERLAARPALTDTDMVREQRVAMLNPDAPNASVEAILHGILPFPWVDHTHADAVVTLTNTPGGAERIAALYGDRVLVLPYVMPGFILARAVYERLQQVDIHAYEGMVLLNHGVFTWGDSAKQSYERMIGLVSEAEELIASEGAWDVLATDDGDAEDLVALATLRRAVGRALGAPVVARLDATAGARGFVGREDCFDIGGRGPVTPDHVIRTKRLPLLLAAGADPDEAVAAYVSAYSDAFSRLATPGLTQLDPAPRAALWPGHGVVAFGRSVKDADIVRDIARHTRACIQRGEALGGWRALGEQDLFEMEYWELEQAKLKRGKKRPAMAGRVALVTGGLRGIGRASVDALRAAGVAVCALDIDPQVAELGAADPGLIGVVCDVTSTAQVDAAVAACVRAFGGLDMLVSNAGVFPTSVPLGELDDAAWDRSMDLNLSAHQRVLRAAIPFLTVGADPSVVFVASKNVPAPGAGVAAYSVAKAGMTQLARVAAIELADRGVRVNVVHPDAVFDTNLWSEDKVAARAAHYGLSPAAYKSRNLLGIEIASADVGHLVMTLLSPALRATTGAQIPVDGGHVRVI